MALKIGIEADVSGAQSSIRGLKGDVQDLANAASKVGGIKMDTSGLARDVDQINKLKQSLTERPEPIYFQADTDFAVLGLSKLQQAMEKTKQASKKLGDIKIDAKSFGDASKQLFDLQKNMEAINRTVYGRDLKKRVEASGQQLDKPFDVDWAKVFPNDQRRAQEEMQRFYGKLSQGPKYEIPKPDRMQPEQTPQPVVGGGSTGGSSGFSLGRAGRWALGTTMNMAGTAAGLAGIGSIIGAVVAGFREHLSVMNSSETVYKRLATGESFGEVEQGVRELADALQITASEAGKLTEEFVRASGRTGDPNELLIGAGQLGRGLGMDPNNSAMLMGRAALVGTGQDKASQRDFAALLANTIASGSMFARSEQVMEDLVGHIGDIASGEGRRTSEGELTKFAGLLSTMYQNDALRGGGAQNILSGLSGLGGGGDVVKEMFSWKAFGSAAKNDYITMEAFKDANPFATVKDITGEGSDNTTKLDLAWAEAKKQAEWLKGGTDKTRKAYMLKLLTGMKMPLSEAAVDSLDEMQKTEGGFGKFKSWMGKQGIDAATLNPEALGNLAKLYKSQSQGMAIDFKTMARDYVTGYDKLEDKSKAKITQSQRDKLQGMIESDDMSGLMKVLPKIVAESGAANNPAEQARKATTDLTNTLEQTVGPQMQKLVETFSRVGTEMAPALETALKNLNTAVDLLTPVVTNVYNFLKEHWPTWDETRGQTELGDVEKGDSLIDYMWGAIKKSPLGQGFPKARSAWTKAFEGWKPPKLISDADATMGAGDYPGEGLHEPAFRTGGGFGGEGARFETDDGEPVQNASPGKLANTPFGRLIARGEGDYNSVNRGKAGGYRSGKEDLENMTVREVMSAQRNRKFNAAGRYQIIRETMADAYKALHLTGDEKFDRKTQDRIFEQYLAGSRRPAIRDFISGRSNDVNAAIYQASQEWASVANPKTGRSFYHGKGNNRASIRVDEMESALRSTRKTMSQIGSGLASLPQPKLKTRTAGFEPDLYGDRKKPTGLAGSDPVAYAFPITSGAEGRPHNDRLIYPFEPAQNKAHLKMRVLSPANTPKPVLPEIGKADMLKPAIPEIGREPPKTPVTEAPKTPPEIDKQIRTMSMQDAINARWQGQLAMEVVHKDSRGNIINKRTGLAVSEPQMAGTGGSYPSSTRFIWNDEVQVN